ARSSAVLTILDTFVGIHVEFSQRLDEKIMLVAANSPDADFFPFEIFGSFHLRLAEHTVGENILYTADENEIGEALNVGPHITDCARYLDLCVAVQRRRRSNRR